MYLLCEGETGVVILDQHAAAERVTFERLRRAYAARTVAMQPLLVPERVELSAEEVALVEERAADLASVGVDLAPIGPTTVAVRAVPALLTRADPRRLARDLVSELSRQGNDFCARRRPRARDDGLPRLGARRRRALADEEARALLARRSTRWTSGRRATALGVFTGRPVVCGRCAGATPSSSGRSATPSWR
jgi:DNA mismatch repair protein MutL